MRWQASMVVSGTDRLLRPYGLTLHPNTLGGYCLAALLCLTGWLSVDRGLARWRQGVRIFVMALALWSLCISFSRSAWGGLVAGDLFAARVCAPPRAPPPWSAPVPVLRGSCRVRRCGWPSP